MNTTIPYYPVHLHVKGRTCLVVGGGKVGLRKARTLIQCGAWVRMVSPVFSQDLPPDYRGRIHCIAQPYHPRYLEGAFLVFAATNRAPLNQQIATDARTAGILCNVADDPQNSDFILPALIHRGDLILTVSTSGNSPAFAKKLRQDLEQQFGPEYGAFLMLMGRIRSRLLATGHDPESHKTLFNALITQDLPGMVAAQDHARINALLGTTLGSEYTYENLMAGDPT